MSSSPSFPLLFHSQLLCILRIFLLLLSNSKTNFFQQADVELVKN
ncbi:hypothetical protein X975_00731, partial [Stegodyphus mimosarum]